jgi:hypothetical protein
MIICLIIFFQVTALVTAAGPYTACNIFLLTTLLFSPFLQSNCALHSTAFFLLARTDVSFRSLHSTRSSNSVTALTYTKRIMFQAVRLLVAEEGRAWPRSLWKLVGTYPMYVAGASQPCTVLHRSSAAELRHCHVVYGCVAQGSSVHEQCAAWSAF